MSQDLCSPLHCNVCLMLQAHDPEYQSDSSSKTPPRVFKSCNGCHLAKYCNRSHQKLDWPLHQEFCCALQKLTRLTNISHPFLLSGEPKSREDIENTIVQLKYLLRQALGRPLEYHEEELTSHPVYCPECYRFQNVTVLCPQCKNQAYCSEEHLTQHKSEHVKVCGLMELYYSPFKTIPTKADLGINIEQRIDRLEHADLVEAFEKAFQCKLPTKPTRCLEDYQLFGFAADFSCIGSICYALSHMDMPSFKDSRFVIFIIGASIESVLWFREIHCKFLMQQYPHITHLDLHFIGPEAAASDIDILQFTYLDAERTIHFHSYKGLFQTYCLNFKVKPTIMVAFNCGFSEFARYYNSAPHVTDLNAVESLENETESLDPTKDTWYYGLVEILQTFDTPIIFTSFTKQESDFDFAALQKAAHRQLLKVRIDRIFKVDQNPFRDLRPLRQWYVRDQEMFYYRNGYIQAVRSKLMT